MDLEKTNTRPSKVEYYLEIAETVAKRSTCIRRKFGSVIVKDDRIVSTGYNGSPRGVRNCCDVGICNRDVLGIPQGQQYELCVSIHSENNAIISASAEEMKKATLYLACIPVGSNAYSVEPCLMCRRLIINAGITEVVTKERIFKVKDWLN